MTRRMFEWTFLWVFLAVVFVLGVLAINEAGRQRHQEELERYFNSLEVTYGE